MRLLSLTLALATAAGAFYLLASGLAPPPVSLGPPPMDEIDDASRASLEQVLAESEGRGESR